MTTEDRVVLRAQGGDRRAWEQLYVIHAEGIRRYLERLLGDREDAEDLTTEMFARMVESIGGYSLRRIPFSAWLYRIARNLAFDQLRRRRAARRAYELVATPDGPDYPSAEEEALRTLGSREVQRVIARLPLEQRRVVALRFALDRSTPQTAEAIGKTEGAVKALQNRALSTLRERLADAA